MKLSVLTNMWAIDAGAIRSLDARASAMAELMASGMQPMSELTPDKRRIAYNGGNPLIPEIVGDTATLEVCGDIIARAPFFAKAFMDVVDPFDLADALDALASNEAVKTIVLEIDSCGGSASGTSEAYAAITRAQGSGKTVEVRAAGTLASAAYFIACAADRIIATPTTRVGSLGTLIVLCDETAANAMEGEKYEVISSSPAKGLGSDGAVTPALRTEAQRMVDALTLVFKDSVSAGRGFTEAQIAATFTGQVWLAAEALALGLIDAVDSPADEIETPDGTESPPEVPTAVPDGDTESTPASAARAATDKQEPNMALDIKALAALAASRPHHSALIFAEAAKDGATIDGISAAMASADAKAKDDEIAALKAKLSETETAKAKADEDLAKLSALIPKHADPGDLSASGADKPKTVTMAEYSAMNPEARTKFAAEGGRIA